jgi:hypothetical protein
MIINYYIYIYVLEITNTIYWLSPLLYSIYWLLHVSAAVCHHQGASWVRLSYLKYRSIGWYIICVFTWPVCGFVVVPYGTTTIRQTGHITTHYMIHHLFELHFK